MVEAPPLLIHATCVGIGGKAVLLRGPSGSGKSDLALRLIDRGAVLVSDDYTELSNVAGRVMARAPDRIAGKIEVRGLGILSLPFQSRLTVAMIADMAVPDRLPEPRHEAILSVPIPVIAISPFEASAPIKLELALNGSFDHA